MFLLIYENENIGAVNYLMMQNMYYYNYMVSDFPIYRCSGFKPTLPSITRRYSVIEYSALGSKTSPYITWPYSVIECSSLGSKQLYFILPDPTLSIDPTL